MRRNDKDRAWRVIPPHSISTLKFVIHPLEIYNGDGSGINDNVDDSLLLGISEIQAELSAISWLMAWAEKYLLCT